MEHAEYERQMEAIKAATARIFAMAETEEEVCRLEKAINHEVMYLAAIAQSELVKPEGGWDPFGALTSGEQVRPAPKRLRPAPEGAAQAASRPKGRREARAVSPRNRRGPW